MIELKKKSLEFSFPGIHEKASLQISMHRTLRIPDDGKRYPLPPSLGNFPMKHVDDYASNVPASWRKRGGVMMPMYQSEALWIQFSSTYIRDRHTSYPFAVKVATGKVNAVNGELWSNELSRREQDYLVAPTQPWIDGYCVEKGVIRQFVAMPLGSGYTAEEQVTGEAEFGGIQLIVYPMKRAEFDRRYPKRNLFARRRQSQGIESVDSCLADDDLVFGAMGVAPGGTMVQEVYDDPYGFDCWDQECSRCFVHLANSMTWKAITGTNPPHPVLTAKQYSKHGMPWFEYYSEAPAIEGPTGLNQLKSVQEMANEKGEVVLPENQSAIPNNIHVISPKKSKYQVREGEF